VFYQKLQVPPDQIVTVLPLFGFFMVSFSSGLRVCELRLETLPPKETNGTLLGQLLGAGSFHSKEREKKRPAYWSAITVHEHRGTCALLVLARYRKWPSYRSGFCTYGCRPRYNLVSAGARIKPSKGKSVFLLILDSVAQRKQGCARLAQPNCPRIQNQKEH